MSAVEATTPKRKRRWLTCLGWMVGLLALFGCWFMIGLSFNFSGQSPLQSLETAHNQWDATGIDDYKMSIHVGSMNNIGRYDFIVQDKNVVSVAVSSTLQRDQTPEPIENIETGKLNIGSGDYFPHSFQDYTIDNLYNFAEQKLSSQPIVPVVVSCNPSWMYYETTFNEEYGYLQSLNQTSCPRWDFGGGWMCGVISHCSAGIRVTEFEPLP
jgi:hypothetical protein